MDSKVCHEISMYAAQKYVDANMSEYLNSDDGAVLLAKDMLRTYNHVSEYLAKENGSSRTKIVKSPI